MPLFDETHVKIQGCFVVWDGISRPEQNDSGNTRWSLKVVVNPTNPDVALLQQLANNELQVSEFRGVLPNGGIMPLGTAGPQEFNGQFPGWTVINCSTFRAPQVFDEAGNILDPMQYGPLLYGGQQVEVLVHCKAYNNKSKGVAARLDGFSIIASAQAPRQDFGGINAAAAFGGGQPGAAAPAGVAPPVVAAAPAPGIAPPPVVAAPPVAPAGAPPAQAHNFLPGQPGAPAAPAPPPVVAAPPVAASRNVSGTVYTEEALAQAGYTPEQIAALPAA